MSDETIGLIVGHTPDEPGAGNTEQQINEWHYNATLAKMVAGSVQNACIIYRDRPNDWRGLPEKVNRTGVDFAVSMHLNAYKGSAKGSETLYWHASGASHTLARRLQQSFVGALGTKSRGAVPRKKGERGWRLLRYTEMPICICEPFFIDDQLKAYQPKTAELAEAYAKAITDYRKSIITDYRKSIS